MEKDLVIPPPTVSCLAPTLWRVDRCECYDGSLPTLSSYGVPMCATTPPPPPPVLVCTATISYVPTAPAAPTVDSTPGCDAAGMELALAVILARLLGAPN